MGPVDKQSVVGKSVYRRLRCIAPEPAVRAETACRGLAVALVVFGVERSANNSTLPIHTIGNDVAGERPVQWEPSLSGNAYN